MTKLVNPFTLAARDANDRGERDLAKRITTEGRIVSAIVKKALAMGYGVSVNDGEETTLHVSTSYRKIMAHCFTTDEDVLTITNPHTAHAIGWVHLVYGNCGHDVVSDHSSSAYFDRFMKSINEYADTFA